MNIKYEEAYDLYWNKQLSFIEIGKLFKIDRREVSNHFKNVLNLKLRSRSEDVKLIYQKDPELVKQKSTTQKGKCLTEIHKQHLKKPHKLTEAFFDSINKVAKSGKRIMFNTKPELKFKSLIEGKLSYTPQKHICGTLADFYIPSLNLAIFIDGDYWHCNPNCYKEDFYNKSLQMTAKEVWERDKAVNEKLIKDGYKVLRIWESDLGNIKLEENLQEILIGE